MYAIRSYYEGVTLACYEWSVEKPKKQLIIIHGLAEHAQRYNDFAQNMNKKGISVYSMDLRGHGHVITSYSIHYTKLYDFMYHHRGVPAACFR